MQVVRGNETVTNFSPVNTMGPDLDRFPLFARAHGTTVTLRAGENGVGRDPRTRPSCDTTRCEWIGCAGDVLYLPAFWWHQVNSTGVSNEPIVAAVNLWYEPHSRLAAHLMDVLLDHHLAPPGAFATWREVGVSVADQIATWVRRTVDTVL